MQKTAEKQKLDFSRSALFQMETRVSLKYYVNGCRCICGNSFTWIRQDNRISLVLLIEHRIWRKNRALHKRNRWWTRLRTWRTGKPQYIWYIRWIKRNTATATALTAIFSKILNSTFLPMQLIYQGKTAQLNCVIDFGCFWRPENCTCAPSFKR